MPASWPTLAQLRLTLGVTAADTGRDALLESALGAAIEQVHMDCGADPVTVEFTAGVPVVELVDDEAESPVLLEPTWSLHRAALLLATAASKAPDAPHGIAAIFDSGAVFVASRDPRYRRMLVGAHVRYGVG